MGIRIDRIVLRQLQMPLVHFFETSFSRTYSRDIVIVEAVSGAVSGWGEVTAGENPFYNEEWTDSIWPLLIKYVAPRILNADLDSAAEVIRAWRISAATTWRAAAWKRLCGICRRGCGIRFGKKSEEERAAKYPVAFR